MALTLTIPAFPDGGPIPRLHSCESADLSPALEWSGEPAGTASFALIVEDPDAPSGTWNHWLLWDLPATTHHLPQGVRPDKAGVKGTNDFGRLGYGGPCPPKGHGPHRYYFRLYALKVSSIGVPEGARRAKMEAALRPSVLEEAVYMGKYERS
jgi:Raf kinase inhibitor-like YbhB/YbcL family protein